MGIGKVEIDYLGWIGRFVDWKNVRTVCDLGLQELGDPHAGPEDWHTSLNAMMHQIDPTRGPMSRVDVENMLHSGLASALWKEAGIEYRAIDLYDRPDCTFLDLNFDEPPAGLLQHFDVVFNYGTTEHICNQWQAFKTIHDITRPNGWMLHSLPFAGFTNHGLFNYNLKFFTSLCAWNGYELRDAFLTVDANDQLLDPHVLAQMRQDKPFLHGSVQESQESIGRIFRSTTTGIRVLIKKGEHHPFRPALDLPMSAGKLRGMHVAVGANGVVHKEAARSKAIHIISQSLARPLRSLRSRLKPRKRLRSLIAFARAGWRVR